MEQLKIKNFLVIKNAKFDVGKINIIIGPQANGKSILVKLLYLFRETISESFLVSVKNNELQKDFLKKIEESFEKYFPHYTWKNKDFQIIYIRDDIEIKISKTSRGRTSCQQIQRRGRARQRNHIEKNNKEQTQKTSIITRRK